MEGWQTKVLGLQSTDYQARWVEVGRMKRGIRVTKWQWCWILDSLVVGVAVTVYPNTLNNSTLWLSYLNTNCKVIIFLSWSVLNRIFLSREIGGEWIQCPVLEKKHGVGTEGPVYGFLTVFSLKVFKVKWHIGWPDGSLFLFPVLELWFCLQTLICAYLTLLVGGRVTDWTASNLFSCMSGKDRILSLRQYFLSSLTLLTLYQRCVRLFMWTKELQSS